MIKKGLIFLILIFLPFTTNAQDYSSIYKAFSQEINQKKSSLPFIISKKSYAKLKFPAYIKGTYRVGKIQVTPLKHSIYKLDLTLVKKRGVVSFSEKLVTFFWLGKHEIVFLTRKGKTQFNLPGCDINIIKTNFGYTIKKQKQEKEFNIPLEGGVLHLFVRTSYYCQ